MMHVACNAVQIGDDKSRRSHCYGRCNLIRAETRPEAAIHIVGRIEIFERQCTNRASQPTLSGLGVGIGVGGEDLLYADRILTKAPETDPMDICSI